MSVPCEKNARVRDLVNEFAEVLKTEAHKLGSHGLAEEDFYNSGLFRGAIERIRGQFSATMKEKREFVRAVLSYMQDGGFIEGWEAAGENNRHDYVVTLKGGRISVIELKGCLDGNNTNIFERPANANEFVVWSVCTNKTTDPRHNAWSGLHVRLSADIISRDVRVDGLVVWDMVCGTVARPCPKVVGPPDPRTPVANYLLPPPCIFLLPGTVPSPRNNPKPTAQPLADVHFLAALHECFGGKEEQLSYVDFEVEHRGAETVRKTRVRRGDQVVSESDFTPIQRS